MNISRLSPHQIKVLGWKKDLIYPSQWARKGVLTNVSSLLHAISEIISIPYRIGEIDGRPLNRTKFVQTLKNDLETVLKRVEKNQDSTRIREVLNRLQNSEEIPIDHLETIGGLFHLNLIIFDLKGNLIGQTSLPALDNYGILLYIDHGYEVLGIKNSEGWFQSFFHKKDRLVQKLIKQGRKDKRWKLEPSQ